MSTLARRTIGPVGPDGLSDPSARAVLIADRLRGITGRQRVIADCWKCGKAWPGHATDQYEIGDDGWPVCIKESECDERAANAGLVYVLGTPGDGGVA